MAVNPDHVHIFIEYPLKYSVSYISKMIEGMGKQGAQERISLFRNVGDHLWAPNCYHGYPLQI